MDKEQKLAEQINTYAQLAKENPNIDAAALMLNAVKTENRNLVSSNAKRWAYLISLGLPPFGLLFTLKYYFSGEDDAKNVATTCAALTVFSLLLFWLFSKMLFSSAGVDVNQIQQIKPQDIQKLYQ